MNRATADRFNSKTSEDITKGNACLQTPPAIFQKLNHDFGKFDLDLTANEHSHLLPKWFGPGSPLGRDALKVIWMEHGTNGYSNPPYGPFVPLILTLAKKRAKFGFSSTFLLPMRANKSFRINILQGAADLLFCDERICFYENDAPKVNLITGKPDVAMFDSIVVNYRPGYTGKVNVGVWDVPKHY